MLSWFKRAGTRHAKAGEIQATGLFHSHDVRHAVMKVQVLFHSVIMLGGFHRTRSREVNKILYGGTQLVSISGNYGALNVKRKQCR